MCPWINADVIMKTLIDRFEEKFICSCRLSKREIKDRYDNESWFEQAKLELIGSTILLSEIQRIMFVLFKETA